MTRYYFFVRNGPMPSLRNLQSSSHIAIFSHFATLGESDRSSLDLSKHVLCFSACIRRVNRTAWPDVARRADREPSRKSGRKVLVLRAFLKDCAIDGNNSLHCSQFAELSDPIASV